jgi:hypothetical protein
MEKTMSGIDGPSAHDQASANGWLSPEATEASQQIVAASMSPLTRDFLNWIARTPRTYEDAMEAWRSSCPRFTIWEDALGDGLFRVERDVDATMNESKVVLTPRGRTLLNHCSNQQATRLNANSDDQ